MVKAIIISDQEKNIKDLKLFILNHSSEIDMLGEAVGYLAGVNLINTVKPDLVFLDLSLSGSLIGFNVLDNFSNPCFKTIIISDHQEYLLKAFEYDVISYILKPIEPRKLIIALNKVISYYKFNVDTSCVKEFLPLQSTYKIDLIEISNIMYLLADGKYTLIKLKDNKEILSSTNLKVYEDKLTTGIFFRVHKKCLVNINNVQLIDKRDGLFCLLKNGDKIPISRRKKEQFLKYIGLKE